MRVLEFELKADAIRMERLLFATMKTRAALQGVDVNAAGIGGNKQGKRNPNAIRTDHFAIPRQPENIELDVWYIPDPTEVFPYETTVYQAVLDGTSIPHTVKELPTKEWECSAFETTPIRQPSREGPNDGKNPITIPIREVLDADPCDATREFFAGQAPDTLVSMQDIIDNFTFDGILWAFELVKDHSDWVPLMKRIARNAYPQAEDMEDAHAMLSTAYQKAMRAVDTNAGRRRVSENFKDAITRIFRV